MGKIKKFTPDYCNNEREVESKLIVSYLLPALGYTIDTWYQEKKENRFRLDFLACPVDKEDKSVPKVVIESKHPCKQLNDHVPQLENYMLGLDIQYGLLTNGREIRIYSKLNSKEIILVYKCFTLDIEQKIPEISKWIGREALLSQDVKPAIMEQKSMKTIAVYHNKGGVGKTTTVVNLAAAFAKKGQRVLIIDLDSQANSTFATGLLNFSDEEKDDIKDNYIYHLLNSRDALPIKDVVRPARYTGYKIDVIPAHINLMENETELVAHDLSRLTLWKKLKQVQDDYDVVLIDTPPSLNLYARIALITAEYLLIPSDLKPFANEGLVNVKNFVKDINGYKEAINIPPLNIIGVLPTKVSANAKFAQGTLSKRIAAVKERYGLDVLEQCVIHELDDLAKCIEQTVTVGDLELTDPRSIFDYKPHSKSAEEFDKLADVIDEKIG
ncbi:MAG: AAA family ATPase [Thiotrichaceae bacterium]|nr:AAA family ATPase [Thiotrichaceae bacterium]